MLLVFCCCCCWFWCCCSCRTELLFADYGGQGVHRQHWEKGAKKDYSVQCGLVGLMVLSGVIWLPPLVLPNGQSLSGPRCSYCSWKCGVGNVVLLQICDSYYQHCYRYYSSKSLAGDSIQFSVVLIGYAQFLAAFVLRLSLVEVHLVACCLCSTEHGPCIGGYFLAPICILCDLSAFYCLYVFFTRSL